MTEVPSGEQLADKAAIRELIDRFFFGMDTNDPDIMMSAFTSDGVCGGAHGFDEMLDLFSLVRRVGQGRHVAANQIIEVTGDTAHADTNAIAFVVTPEDGRDLVRTRATRYVDDLVRTPAGWRITHRRGFEQQDIPHDTVWQSTTERDGEVWDSSRH